MKRVFYVALTSDSYHFEESGLPSTTTKGLPTTMHKSRAGLCLRLMKSPPC